MGYLNRLIEIVKATLVISEVKGVSIQPHYALSPGELISNVEVQLLKPDIMDSSKKVVAESVKVDVYSRVTVWEFKNYVTRLLGLSPKYAMVKISHNQEPLREDMHGMMMGDVEIGLNEKLKPGTVITVEKIPYPEQIQAGEIIEQSDSVFDFKRNQRNLKTTV